MTGAPYLARFSRDVGYHCSFPLTLASSEALSGQHRFPAFFREPDAYEAEFIAALSRPLDHRPPAEGSAAASAASSTSLPCLMPFPVCLGLLVLVAARVRFSRAPATTA